MFHEVLFYVHTTLKMEPWSFFVPGLIFALPFLLLFFISKKHKPRKLPPGPMKLPIIGHLYQISNDLPHVSFQQLAGRYGPLMMLQLGSIPTLVVSSALVARAIFKVHDIIFSGRPQLHGAKKLSYNFFNISLAPYGEYWREVRKIATLDLFSMRKVKSFRFMRGEEVANMLELIDKGRLNGPVDVSALTLSLANTVTCRAAYGTKTDQTKRFFAVLHEAQQLFIEVNIADVFPSLGWINKFNGVDLKIERCFKELDMFYNQVIEDHRDPSRCELDHDRKDFIDILLDIQRDPNQAIALTDDHIKGILMDIFFGGSDTSAATLVWTMTELIKHPKIMKKAQDEVRDIAKGKEYVDESDLPNLHYLQLVLKESFRLHPPAPLLIPRETIEDCEVMGFHIPAKTRVFVNAKAIGLDPECWEDPYRFKPERFLSSSIDFRGQDFELIPFGIGRRGCPGLNLGLVLTELALSNLLYRFDWELPEGMTSEEIDMKEAPGVTTHKKTPLVLVAAPRPLS